MSTELLSHPEHEASGFDPPQTGDTTEETIDVAIAANLLSAEQWGLRPKHIETLALMAEGLSNKQIADRMGITVGTVKTHVSEVFKRMNVERRAEAILLARRLVEVRDRQRETAERGEPLLNLLIANSSLRSFPKGTLLFKRGEFAHELYFIRSGVVRLDEFDITLREGDVLGELGLLSTTRQRSATARCETDVSAFVMGEEQVRSLHFTNPQFAWFLAATIATRVCGDRLALTAREFSGTT